MTHPVTIEPVTIYRVTYAGGLHDDYDTKEAAESRRQRIEAVDRANAVLDAGGTLQAANEAAGGRLWGDIPEALHAVTKSHGFVISHWQCGELPAYSIRQINYDGTLDVYGRGGWMGVYGQEVRIEALAGYPSAPTVREWTEANRWGAL